MSFVLKVIEDSGIGEDCVYSGYFNKVLVLQYWYQSNTFFNITLHRLKKKHVDIFHESLHFFF